MNNRQRALLCACVSWFALVLLALFLRPTPNKSQENRMTVVWTETSGMSETPEMVLLRGWAKNSPDLRAPCTREGAHGFRCDVTIPKNVAAVAFNIEFLYPSLDPRLGRWITYALNDADGKMAPFGQTSVRVNGVRYAQTTVTLGPSGSRAYTVKL